MKTYYPSSHKPSPGRAYLKRAQAVLQASIDQRQAEGRCLVEGHPVLPAHVEPALKGSRVIFISVPARTLDLACRLPPGHDGPHEAFWSGGTICWRDEE